MNYVLDCSFCAALFLPHEKSNTVKDIFRKITDEDVFVPVQFWGEMTELLLTAQKRNRLKHADAIEINRLLTMYRFNTIVSYGGDYTGQILDLSALYGLGTVESAYLELAVQKKAKLGTLNENLKAACLKAGIKPLL